MNEEQLAKEQQKLFAEAKKQLKTSKQSLFIPSNEENENK